MRAGGVGLTSALPCRPSKGALREERYHAGGPDVLDRNRQPRRDDARRTTLSFLHVGGVVCEERSSWEEIGASSPRAPTAARSFARAWRRLLARDRVVELLGTPRTTRMVPPDRNLQLSRPLAQSHRRICSSLTTRASSYPSALQTPPSGCQTRQSRAACKAVVQLIARVLTPIFFLWSAAPDLSGAPTAFRGNLHLRQLTDHKKAAPKRSSSRVRHCLRRSRESDAQLPLPQLLVTARRIARAEHVTPASATDAILHGFAMKPSSSAPPRAALSRAASISRPA